MKIKNKLKNFDEILTESLLNESDMGITGIASGKPRRDKYFPPTIEQVPTIRFKNYDIPMGQTEDETDAPKQLIYPFDTMFTNLVDIYVKMNEILMDMESSKDLPTLSKEKSINVKEAIKNLTSAIKSVESTASMIEEVSI